MSTILFRNARLFDGISADLVDGVELLVVDGKIEAIEQGTIKAPSDAAIVACGGRTLMPGLIDAHVHVYASSLNLMRVAKEPFSYLAHYAARFLGNMLDHGFTTVRDVGGGDVGLAHAIQDGFCVSPRLFYGGRVLSQTGGHGDFRPGDHDHDDCGMCACHADSFAVIADGEDQVRKAVREELRRGAAHIKIMGSGGVASPTDPLERCQYSDGEIRAAVDECERFGVYVAAHCHPTIAVRRSVELGVRSIEHGTMIDEETAKFVAGTDAFVVPTMAVIFALLEEGERLGFPSVSMDKLRKVQRFAIAGLDIMHRNGVRMGFGTDLLGSTHVRQATEFSLRAQVLPSIDILRSATSVNAELLLQPDTLGCLKPGAAADLLIVDGDPLRDIALLAAPAGQNLPVIMKAGQFHKRAI
jgi:imidazolonepropionase-like amidohydrolase